MAAPTRSGPGPSSDRDTAGAPAATVGAGEAVLWRATAVGDGVIVSLGVGEGLGDGAGVGVGEGVWDGEGVGGAGLARNLIEIIKEEGKFFRRLFVIHVFQATSGNIDTSHTISDINSL